MRACVVLDKCDFEDGLCDMEQVNWRVSSGSTPTKNTGPDYDHTTFLPEGWFELSFEFSFCFPFRKGANNCYKPSDKQQAALKKCIFQNPGISNISDNICRKHLRKQNH